MNIIQFINELLGNYNISVTLVSEPQINAGAIALYCSNNYSEASTTLGSITLNGQQNNLSKSDAVPPQNKQMKEGTMKYYLILDLNRPNIHQQEIDRQKEIMKKVN